MPQKISHSLIVLLIFIIVAPLAAGCGVSPARGGHDPGVDPFVDDRIATVRLVLTDETWQYCREHAFEERYVRADFWWDGELVPDWDDEVIADSALTHNGEIRHAPTRELVEGEPS